ncbi:M18 family aminopeptidase [Myxococcota bacterium]|nr:M18 family aminopeptidase [Myxococcota bacterium]
MYTNPVVDFVREGLNQSPSPYHAVDYMSGLLKQRGVEPRDEVDAWPTPRKPFYTTRAGASLIAVRPGRGALGEVGFRLLAAHTDSPTFRLKHRLAQAAHGVALLDVEPYGGGIYATWADRDLGVAGRVFFEGEGGEITARLVDLDWPIAFIPNLAIHLNRGVNTEGLILNPHKHIRPVWALDQAQPEAALRRIIADRVDVDPARILGHELSLYDLQPAQQVGLDGAFLRGARLDDLAMCYAALDAFLDAPVGPHWQVIAFFDHEESGSLSPQGAKGSFLMDVLSRLADGEALRRALARSDLVSADMAHAVHPSYADVHDGTHQPVINGGPVIKTNVNLKYATSGASGALFRRAAAAVNAPVQEFVNRADLACGGTIGSMTAAALGVRAVDVGNAMWSMHSARETTGAKDLEWMSRVMRRVLMEPS